MGPTWIVVFQFADGSTRVERFTDEEIAREFYDQPRLVAGKAIEHAYLATCRSEMHASPKEVR